MSTEGAAASAAPSFTAFTSYAQGKAMPFSSLTDLIDLYRAEATPESAREKLKPSPSSDVHERDIVAYIVASVVPLALDENDLA